MSRSGAEAVSGGVSADAAGAAGRRGFSSGCGRLPGSCLARNHRRKSCKVIILYSIFFFISAIFTFIGYIVLFLAVEDELSLSCTRLAQCQLDGMVDEVEDVVFPGKADFCFCRMDVDIHKVGRHLKKQDPPGNLPCIVVPLNAISMPAIMVRLRT